MRNSALTAEQARILEVARANVKNVVTVSQPSGLEEKLSRLASQPGAMATV